MLINGIYYYLVSNTVNTLPYLPLTSPFTEQRCPPICSTEVGLSQPSTLQGPFG